MILTLAVLLSEDNRGRFAASLPFTSQSPLWGRSPTQLLDDLTLRLMENVPKMKAKEVSELLFRPRLEFRRVAVSLDLQTIRKKLKVDAREGGRGESKLDLRFGCALSQWPHEGFWEVTAPRLSPEVFAVAQPKYMRAALERILERVAMVRGIDALYGFEKEPREYIELIEVPVDLPTPLPSHRVRRGRMKSGGGVSQGGGSERREAPKRKLVSPAELSRVGEALTRRALDGEGQRAHRRGREIDQLLAAIEDPGACVLLVGPKGVGKTAIVEEVAYRLAHRAPTILERRDVWRVEANRIISGMSMVGAWEGRVNKMAEELSQRQDILYVPDLPSLVFLGRSAESETNVAEYLEPYLAQSEIRIIGESTPERLASVREKNPGFFQRFRALRVDEMDEAQTLVVLANEVRHITQEEDLRVTPEAMEVILSLTRRFERSSALPGRAVSLLRRVLADHQRTKLSMGWRLLESEGVIGYYTERSGLPEYVLEAGRGRPPDAIRAYFDERIVGQPEAIEAAIDVVIRIEQGLCDPEKPFGTYLFVGPTGVGKTETAKALAGLLFGSADRIVRMDMSEFQAPWSTIRLFGGAGEPDGELTRAVSRQPFSVVLLDEIEKAHPAVFDALLQVLGEGRLTNAAGFTVSFRNTIVIMTSNLGVQEAERRVGFGAESVSAAAQRYRAAAQAFFRPEMFNRIDLVVPFRSLTREHIIPLTRRLLEGLLSRRGLARSEVMVNVDRQVPSLLVERGFEPRFGARSMRRVLERVVAVPLAQQLMAFGSSRLSFVFLEATDGQIGLTVVRPKDLPLQSKPRFVPAQSWEELERRLESAEARLSAFSSGEALKEMEHTRSEGLESLNHRQLNTLESHQLEFAARLVETVPRLRLELEELRESILPPEAYLEQAWLVGPDSFSAETGVTSKQRFVVRRGFLGPFRPELAERAFQAELELLNLSVGARAQRNPDARPALLHIQAVGSDVRSCEWGTAIATMLAASLPSRATRTFSLDDAGTWSQGKPSPRSRSLALEIPGADALLRLEGELGIWVNRVTHGLRRGVAAAVVAEVGTSGISVQERLLQLPRGSTRSVEGTQIVRWFEDGVAIDSPSGCKLEIARPASLTEAWLVRARENLFS